MMTLLIVHAAATWALVGAIWTVQLVHYPLFAQVDADAFPRYHAQHMWRMTCVVAPLATLEFATAALLVWQGARQPWLLGSFIPMAVSWLSTWFVQVPLHLRLASGFESATYRRLVKSNWWRTIAWSIRGICLIILLS